MESTANEGLSLGKIIIMIFGALLVVGIVIGIVTLMSSRANATSDQLVSTIDSTEALRYAEYDGQEVLGSSIEAACSKYRGQEFVVAVSTIANNGGACDMTNLGNVTADVYNAVPAGGAVNGNTYQYTFNYDTATGTYSFDGLDYSTGTCLINTNFSPVTSRRMGNSFVKATGHFYTALLLDTTTGKVGGILFQQID